MLEHLAIGLAEPGPTIGADQLRCIIVVISAQPDPAIVQAFASAGQVHHQRLLQQRVAFLLAVGEARNFDLGLIVVAQATAKWLIAAEAAAPREGDLQQFPGGEHALIGRGTDEDFRSAAAAPRVAPDAGSFNPQVSHGLFSTRSGAAAADTWGNKTRSGS